MKRLRRIANEEDVFNFDELVEVKIGNEWVLGQIHDINRDSKYIDEYIYQVRTHEDVYERKNDEIEKYDGPEFDIISTGDKVHAKIGDRLEYGEVIDMTRDGRKVWVQTQEDTYDLDRDKVRLYQKR